jgi:3-deoxy-manno-octulosonate cytidylyltransferase (CMP-KDO synthetase)
MTTSGYRVVIPARYASTRFPGKPLYLLDGRPMIEQTYRRGLESGASEVIIATDDQRIYDAAVSFGADVCMTSDQHQTGTDRLAEVAEQRGWGADDIVVNLQGDEPLMPPDLLDQVAAGLEQHVQAGIATICTPIDEIQDIFDPNIVKVVMDIDGYALYFSRAPIPYHRQAFGTRIPEYIPDGSRYFRHLGLYAYRVKILKSYPQMAASMAERTEALEQLRALWYGIRIHVQEALTVPPLGIDTKEDLARVEAALQTGGPVWRG